MKIQVVCSSSDQYAGEIVEAALIRSFSQAQVSRTADSVAANERCCVWVNPADNASHDLKKHLAGGGKSLVLGRLGPKCAEILGLEHRDGTALAPQWGECPVEPTAHHNATPASVHYHDAHPLARNSPIVVRPLCRFDFADEWNNLGFGRITLDGGPWSLQSAIGIGSATLIARLNAPGQKGLVYSALCETASGAALWFNRPVGPVDSLEWRVIESFLGDYRADDLPCFPYLSEIPAGYSGAVSARLDCDEAVGSARPLVELYGAKEIPFSLSLLTGQPLDARDMQLLREVIAHRGSVLSHSVHHYPNWGGSYERARTEADDSRAWFDAHLREGMPMRFSVSPFHQNPPYAVQALADSGYEGFVGGIIANDPEYLLGRAGRVPFVTAPALSGPMVSLSTQCMLHGDCYHRYGNSIDTYSQSFDQHLAARSIFGYLDHPFSDRYQYGWQDEPVRLAAHSQLIDHINSHSDIWWASLSELLGFLRQRDAVLVEASDNGTLTVEPPSDPERLPLAICWKGRQFAY